MRDPKGSRRDARLIETAAGPALVDLSTPGRVRAAAGGDSGIEPLRVGGRAVAVALTLVHAPGGGFSLLAEDAPLAWDHESPGERLPPAVWKSAAGAVLEGAESFLSRHPQVGQVADLTAMRARIAEIDESLDIARDWADQLRAERDHLVSQSGPLRRGLIAGVD